MKALALLALIGAMVACDREDEEFSAADATEVRAIFDSVLVDIRAANWTAWGSRFTGDARLHPSNGPALVGRPAMVAWAQAFPPIESVSFGAVQVTGNEDLAWGTSAVFLKLLNGPADTAKQLVVFTRDSTHAWKVVAVSLTSDLPLPVSPPPAPARR